MSWRRGEVWLEAEVGWFREPVAVQAFAGMGPAAIPSLAPPPGLVASRVRRAAWERRRHLRRARTTAVALSPAVVIALAALRSGAGAEASVLLDDPPSLTFRVGTGLPVAEGTTIGPPPGRETAVSRRRETAARAETAPTIAWHRAVSTGCRSAAAWSTARSCRSTGPNWVTWNPVTDSSPNAPVRLYGNDRAIHAVVSIAAAYRAAHPDAARDRRRRHQPRGRRADDRRARVAPERARRRHLLPAPRPEAPRADRARPDRPPARAGPRRPVSSPPARR